MRRALLLLAPLALLALQGCTSDQRLAAGRAWGRHECGKEVGRTDRDRCSQLATPRP